MLRISNFVFILITTPRVQTMFRNYVSDLTRNFEPEKNPGKATKKAMQDMDTGSRK